MRPIDIVKTIYAAFTTGDIPAIISRLHPDCAWESWSDNFAQKAGVPWLLPRRGPAEALEFFGEIATFTIHDFQVLSLMDGGHQVAAEIVMDATVGSTSRRYRDEEVHLWTFDEQGRVIRFRHYTDTAKQIAASIAEA